MLDESDNTSMDTPVAQPPEESNNRTFLIVGAVLAALIFVIVVCLIVWFSVISPGLNKTKKAAAETQAAQNAAAMQAGTATAMAALWTPTSTPSRPPTVTNTSVPSTPTNTRTPVVVVNLPTSTATNDPSTMIAMQTQLSGQMTQTAIASITRGAGGEGMPKTGFFDEVGIPSLIVLALALVVVIFLARRMRRANAR